MLDIARNILDIVKSLLGLSDQLKTADRQRCTDMAALFESISSCLAATSGEIRAGNVPHGRCGELITYSQALPGAISREVGPARVAELATTLHSASRVEQIAMVISNAPDKEAHLAHLEEVLRQVSCVGESASRGAIRA